MRSSGSLGGERASDAAAAVLCSQDDEINLEFAEFEKS